MKGQRGRMGRHRVGAAGAQAHRLGDSYLYLQVYEDSVSGRFEIALTRGTILVQRGDFALAAEGLAPPQPG